MKTKAFKAAMHCTLPICVGLFYGISMLEKYKNVGWKKPLPC